MDDLTEDDHIVRMPPLKSYTVRARIKSVEKGTPRFALEDEVMDAMTIQGHAFGDDEYSNTCPTDVDPDSLYSELRAWDELSDEALRDFERLADQSAPPERGETFWDRLRNWTFDDWIDYLRCKWCG